MQLPTERVRASGDAGMVTRRRILEAVSGGALYALLGACAAPGIAPDAGRTTALRRVRVVALGPVPLELPPGMASALAAQLPKPTVSAARGVAVFSGILMLVDMPDALARSAEAGRAVTEQLGQGQAWSPQAIMASRAAAQLAATGREVSGPVEKPIPGVSVDDYRLSLSPFYKARGAWWNETRSTVDYASPDVGNVDALVEIGMAYSAFFFGELLVFLDVKVVDPSTRSVIARARDYAHKPIGTPEAALKDEAAPFKQVFDEMATSLVRSVLARSGFVPP